MGAQQWKMKVVGTVTRTQGAQRIAVPAGEYTMTDAGSDTFELAREGVPTFTLSLHEVTAYFAAKDLKSVDGSWP